MKFQNLKNKIKCLLGLHDVEECGRIDFLEKTDSSYVFNHSEPWYICKNCHKKLMKLI